jgi:cathepsin L
MNGCGNGNDWLPFFDLVIQLQEHFLILLTLTMRTGLFLIASILLLGALVSAANLSERDFQAEFSSFVKKYNKAYKHEDFFNKYNVFKTNLIKIMEHNENSDAGYTVGINEFADLTFAEFKAQMSGYKPKEGGYLKSLNTAPVESDPNVNYPKSIDWRTKNAVTPVKNQGQCNSRATSYR